MPVVEIIKQKGHNFLWIDNDLWMWDIPAEQIAQERLSQKAYGSVLVAGYGLGILQKYLSLNSRVTSVRTVEIMPEIVDANERHFGKIFGEVLISDFYERSDYGQFDCVIGDIWEDILPEVLDRYNRFYDHARRFVKPNGIVLAWGQEFFEALNLQNKICALMNERNNQKTNVIS